MVPTEISEHHPTTLATVLRLDDPNLIQRQTLLAQIAGTETIHSATR